jgi:NIMA (never in mitosis gene a)-related kinase
LIRKWTSEIILGINYLHNNNLLKCIHRDLKPENIFLTGDNQIKIGSLGLSRSTDEDSTIDYTTFAHYNLNPYMSPEMKESKPYSFKTDIWYFFWYS